MAIVVRSNAPGEAEDMELVRVDLPPPGPRDIRLRHTAIGVNFIDIYQRRGLYPLPGGIPGVEGVGVVTELGDDVSDLNIGDRIAYAGAPVGAYASERNLPAWRAVKLPDRVSDESVAFVFLKAITALMLLDRVYPVKAGTTVLMHGAAGGLGQIVIRLAQRRGATVIGIVSSDAKAEIARTAGAQHVIVGRDADLAGAVARLTDGRGVDVAYDGIGGDTLAKTLACVRPFGVVASIGQAGGPIPKFDIDEIGPRRSLALSRPSVMAYVNDAPDYKRAAAAVLAALGDGELDGSGRTYPFDQVVQAHVDLENGRSSGALVLVP